MDEGSLRIGGYDIDGEGLTEGEASLRVRS
jgi:hypothetical protein